VKLEAAAAEAPIESDATTGRADPRGFLAEVCCGIASKAASSSVKGRKYLRIDFLISKFSEAPGSENCGP
jgi:hypothetical protein